MNTAATSPDTNSTKRRRKDRRKPKPTWLRRIVRVFFMLVLVVIVLMALVVGLGRAYLDAHPEIEMEMTARISERIGVPMTFSDMTLRWLWSGPEISIEKLEFKSPDEKTSLIKFDSASIILDVKRFLNSRILGVSSVQLEGSEIVLVRTLKNTLTLNNVDLDSLQAMFAQENSQAVVPSGFFNVRNIDLVYKDQLTEQEIRVEDINAALDNNDQLLELKLTASSDQIAERFDLTASTPNPDLHDGFEWQVLLESDGIHLKPLLEQWRHLLPLYKKTKTPSMSSITTPLLVSQGEADVRVWAQFSEGHIKALNGTIGLNNTEFQRSDSEILQDLEHLKIRFSYEDDGNFTRFKADQIELATVDSRWPENNSMHIKLAKHSENETGVSPHIIRDIDLAEHVKSGLEVEKIERDGLTEKLPGADQKEAKVILDKQVTELDAPQESEIKPESKNSLFNNFKRAEVQAKYLNLTDLAPLLEVGHRYLPLNETTSDVKWDTLKGEIINLNLNASNPNQDQYIIDKANVAFNDLAIPQRGLRQSVSGLNGTVTVSNNQGSVDLNSTGLTYTNLKVFPAALKFTKFESKLNFSILDDRWELASDLVVVENEDLKISSDLKLDINKGKSPVLAVDATLNSKDLDVFKKYYPENVMSEKLHTWLNNNVSGGQSSDVKIKFSGALEDYPFRNNKGEFLAEATVKGMDVIYAKDWPSANLLDADVRFENESLFINAREVGTKDVDPFPLQASIADLKDLIVDLNFEAPIDLEQMENWINISPLKKSLGKTLKNIKVRGQANSKMDLRVPIKNIKGMELNGRLDFSGNPFTLTAFPEPFSDLTGSLSYTMDTLLSESLTANYSGAKLTAKIDTVEKDTLVFVNTTAQLSKFINPTFSRYLDGNSNLDAEIRTTKGQEGIQDIKLRSNLLGTALLLPAPLAKPSDTILPLNLNLDFQKANVGTRQEVFISGNIGGNLLRSRMFAVTDAPDTQWGLHSITLVGGKNQKLFDTIDPKLARIQVLGKFAHVNMDEWFDFINEDRDSTADDALEIGVIDIKLDQLSAVGQTFSNVDMVLLPSAISWQAKVSNPRVSGKITFPKPWAEDSLIQAELDKYYFVLPPESDEEVTFDPREIPNVNLNIKDFKFEDIALGAAEISVRRGKNGANLEKFVLTNPSFSVDGSGGWHLTTEGETTLMNVNLESSNLAQTLSQLGYAPAVSARSAEALIELNWLGNPFDDVLQKVSGEISFKFLNGELQDVEPGAGRFLALLSIAQLPKRLSLDFRDVFNAGLQYDELSADFRLSEGQAYTNNMLMRGPVADLGVIGRIGLATRDFDQAAVVQADLGSSLPIVGVLAGGLGVGAAMLLFSEIFKNPLKQATQIFYKIDGDWSDPQMVRTPPSQLKEVPIAPR